MSRKHFVALVKYINAIMDPHARLQAACAVSSACQETNSNFDVDRFFKACNI